MGHVTPKQPQTPRSDSLSPEACGIGGYRWLHQLGFLKGASEGFVNCFTDPGAGSSQFVVGLDSWVDAFLLALERERASPSLAGRDENLRPGFLAAKPTYETLKTE